MKLTRSQIIKIIDNGQILNEFFLYNIEDIEHNILIFNYKNKPYSVQYSFINGKMVFNTDLSHYRWQDIDEHIDSLFASGNDKSKEFIECTQIIDENIELPHKEAVLLSEEEDVDETGLFYVDTIENEAFDRIVFGVRKESRNQLYSFRTDDLNRQTLTSIICRAYPFGTFEDTPVDPAGDGSEESEQEFEQKNEQEKNTLRQLGEKIRALLTLAVFLPLAGLARIFKGIKKL